MVSPYTIGMDNTVPLYVLTHLTIDTEGEVQSKNTGATFNLFEAETHRAKGVDYDFDTLLIGADWCDDVETTATVLALREVRSMVKEIQVEAVR